MALLWLTRSCLVSEHHPLSFYHFTPPSFCSSITGLTLVPALSYVLLLYFFQVSFLRLLIRGVFPNHPIRSSTFHFLLPSPRFVFLTNITTTTTINTHAHTHTHNLFLCLLSPLTTMHIPRRQAFCLFCSQFYH